jgi:hypothetical protein
MSLSIQEHADEAITVLHQDRELFRYIYRPQTVLEESPRPYFHPLATLQGEVVTDFRPADHRWHHGLSMTCAYLSGDNFWGGPTYQRNQGYVWSHDHGTQAHQRWVALQQDSTSINLIEELHWLNHEQTVWLEEERTIQVSAAYITHQSWTLALSFRLHNVSGQPLSFGSPTTQGRALAGYGGLFWRGPARFLNGDILTPTIEGPDTMGQPVPWLAYRISAPSTVPCTLVFVDDKRNPRYPTTWFVRNDQYPGASYAFMFAEPYFLPPGGVLDLHYQIIIADAVWSTVQIAGAVRRNQA